MIKRVLLETFNNNILFQNFKNKMPHNELE